MSSELIKFLILEDSPVDTELIIREINRGFNNFTYTTCRDKASFEASLNSGNYDVILSDYSLPSFNGLEALAIAREINPNMPFIIITGILDDETAAGCIKSGAWDYVLKEKISKLNQAISDALAKSTRDSNTIEKSDLYQMLFDSSPDALFLMKGIKFIDMNISALKMFKIDKSRLNDLTPLDISPPKQLSGLDSKGEAQKHVQAALDNGVERFEWTHRSLEGDLILAEVTLNRIVINNNSYLQARVHDITKEREIEIELKGTQELNNLIVKNGPDCVTIADKEGNVIFINQSGKDKLSSQGKINYNTLNWFSFWKGKYLDIAKKKFESVLKGAKESFVGQLEIPGYKTYWFDVILTPIVEREDNVEKVLVISRDITNQVYADIKLKESEAYFRMLYEKSPAGYQSLNEDGRLISVNKSWLDLLGYTEEEVLGKWFGDFLKDDYVEKFRTNFPKFKKAGEISGIEFELKSKNRGYITVSFNGKIAREDNGEFKQTHCVLTDISKRKREEDQIKQNEQNLQNILNSMPFGAILISKEKKILHANQAAIKLSGYNSKEEILNRMCHHLLCPSLPDQCPVLDNNLDLDRSERLLINKDGSVIPILKSAIIIKYNGEDVVLETFVDISEMKNAENVIKKSLKEKNILLKEVHHRVKNNMQIISSLLNLQSGNIDNPEILEQFQKSRDRVKSMALIHEKLYETDDFSEIDFSSYIVSLFQSLEMSYQIDPNKIKMNIEIDNAKLDLNRAIPCGLIVNEIITNIYKHAFPGDRKGSITIRFEEKDNLKTLTISDDGIGIPENFVIDNQNSLGLKLVKALTQQLRGKMEFKSKENSTYFILQF